MRTITIDGHEFQIVFDGNRYADDRGILSIPVHPIVPPPTHLFSTRVPRSKDAEAIRAVLRDQWMSVSALAVQANLPNANTREALGNLVGRGIAEKRTVAMSTHTTEYRKVKRGESC